MRPSRLVALALVVVALGAYIYFVERKAPTTDEVKERADKLFPGLEQDKVTRVEITNTHGRFELVKAGDDWKLAAPITDDANGGAVSGLLSSLAFLKAERTLEAKDVKLADYGLQDAKLTLTVHDDKGASHTLKVGDDLPLGAERAALTTGEKVFMIGKYIATDIDRDLAGWRSTELARVMSADVASLTVRSAAGRVALAHAEGVWALTEPIADLADRDRAEGLIGSINGAQVKEHVDAPGDLAALGLASPRIEVTIVRKDDKAPLQLAFGNEREVVGAKQVACRRGDRVMWVDASAISNAGGTLVDWRSRRLVALDTWNAEALAIGSGGAKAALERKDGIWKSGDVEVDGDAVSRRLATLSDLQVVGFDAPGPVGSPLGTVEVKVKDGAGLDVKLYPGTEPGSAIAEVKGRAGFFAVDAARVQELLADPASLAAPRPTPAPTPTP
jgi:hypothetical protein